MYIPAGGMGIENLNKDKDVSGPFLCVYHTMPLQKPVFRDIATQFINNGQGSYHSSTEVRLRALWESHSSGCSIASANVDRDSATSSYHSSATAN